MAPVDATTPDKQLLVEFLFLDAETCQPCGGTLAALRGASDIVNAPLMALGVALDIRQIHVSTPEIAMKEKFRSSPTIRVMGHDIDPAITQDDCPSCGHLAGDAIKVECRTWHWQGKVFQAAPIGKLVHDIMAAAIKLSSGDDNCCAETCCGDGDDVTQFTLSENLAGFFAARADSPVSCDSKGNE